MAVKLTSIKVTNQTVANLNIAAALSGKRQWEMAEEGSQFVSGKYKSKSEKFTKRSKTRNPNKK